MRRLLPLLLVLAVTPAAAEAPEWRGVDASTGQLASVEELTRLAEDFPDSASVRLRLLNALAEAGANEAAGKEALQLVGRGYAFGAASAGQLAGYVDMDLGEWLRTSNEVNRRQIEASTLLATIPADALLVESVARDPNTGDLYATTVVSRALYVKRGEAPWEKLAIEGAGSLSGIAYDPDGKLLWIASGNFEQTPGDEVYSALLGFDPAQGKVVRTLYANGIVALGDVAVGKGGTVYVADPAQGIIHYASPSDAGLRPLVGQGIFRSPQGMVAVPGTDLLIVSDYRYGLAALDMAKGTVRRIAGAKPVMLDGIDTLQRHGNSLIAVQNGARPMRIVKLDMAKDWLSVENLTVLERAHPGWIEPVGGTVDGNRLLYVANGQWERFAEGGAMAEGAEPSPTEIRALSLGE